MVSRQASASEKERLDVQSNVLSDIEGVVIFDANSGIPLFSKLEERIDPSMFTSFIAAVRHFSNQLKLGGLTSFTTEEKIIFMAKRGDLITALIKPQSREFQSTVSLAIELTEQFEDRYEIPKNPQPEMFNDFNAIVNEYLKEVKNPYLSRVARFIHNQYGGEVSIKPSFNKRSGSQGVLDIVATVHEKTEDLRNGLSDLYSEGYTFVRAVDGIALKGDVMEFLDIIDSFGIMVMIRDRLEFVPYFPNRAVIVARHFPDSLDEYLSKFPSEKGRTYIDGNHIFMGSKIRPSKKDPKCFVELWKWRDNDRPELIYPKSKA